MNTNNYDTIIIGGGPAGLAAAIACKKAGANCLLIERESRLGGILKQCIHDGFGLIRFEEKLSGPEYAERYIDMFKKEGIKAVTQTFVTAIKREDGGFVVSVVNREGINDYYAKALILATGCRERTAKQVSIHGTRPSGVFTAGTAQNFTNIMGLMPTKKCVILGSGDIGLIMARRLTLEGAEVLGVYEAKNSPSGLMRNIHQCLNDYNIPLHLSHTVTKTFGHDRLEAVEVCEVDENMSPIGGTERIIECDALILSVGLIPENELAENLDVKIDSRTKGPFCDESFMTAQDGIFSCGNALHVNDLVDYVSESGELAGIAAAEYALSENNNAKNRRLVHFEIGENIMYLVPQMINIDNKNKKTVLYFRSKGSSDNSRLKISINGNNILDKKYYHLRPPEMERLEMDFSQYDLNENSKITFEIEVGKSL